MTYPLLENAPVHDSPEFIQYLREHNVVEYEDDAYLIIQNCKYWREDRPWLTAFQKSPSDTVEPYELLKVLDKYWGWEWLKKAEERQTVKRFHIHIYQPNEVKKLI